MEIKTVSIIGLGALGVLFGNQLLGHMEREDLRIIADSERIKRYQRDGIYCNGKRCIFHYITPEEDCGPADLLLIAVKYSDLNNAIADTKNQVGPNTVILSLLNGISSEEIIGQTYGMDKLLYSVAQGMDALKVGNQLTYEHMGMICFGGMKAGVVSEKAMAVARFFDKTEVPYEVVADMSKRMWGKFMLNVGVNQTTAVYECDFGRVQKTGRERNAMIAAMREVIALSEKEGVNLTEADLDYWLHILGTLNPTGKPSMRQDAEAKRRSELELFAGTVLKLSKKYGLSSPMNQMFYDKIKEMESRY